jgi:hypothetical protein
MTNSNKTTRHIDELHFEHKLWKAELNFYADELSVYSNRLAEVALKNNKDEMPSKIEHFQNQFLIQKEQLDILNHELNLHQDDLVKFAKEFPIAIDHRLFPDQEILHDKIDIFRKIYMDLKKEVNSFFATWL